MFAINIDDVKARIFSEFVKSVAREGAIVCTDEHTRYLKLTILGYEHDSVVQSKGEYVRGAMQINTSVMLIMN